MSEKVFAGINGKVTAPEVVKDFENSVKFDSVYVGTLGAYFREGFKTKFMEYALIERVFIRVQQVNLKTCCGGSTTAYFKLVFVSGGKEAACAFSENEQAMHKALELIHENAPDIAIGFVK